jgi:hypothetical protein
MILLMIFYLTLSYQNSKKDLISSEFSRKTLLKLYTKIRTENLIHYFNESSQDIDHVLDVFIRTNSGGQNLSSPTY